MRRSAMVAAALLAPALLGGCLERRLTITSEPPGALVWLNDVEVGRTPVDVDFEWYGTYDVRLALEGHEPLTTSAKADAPVHEWPGIDLFAAVLPVEFRNDVRWHFELEPALTDRDALLDRARETRGMLSEPVVEDAAEGDDGGAASENGEDSE